MAKVTSKLQVTIPKALADRYGIRPGDEIEWEAAGRHIRVVPAGQKRRLTRADRLRIFDEATDRQEVRQRRRPAAPVTPVDRGWTREELYVRGSAG